MQDGDFSATLAQQFYHGFARQFATLIIVCGYVADDFAVRAIILDVICKDRDSSVVRLLNRCTNGL